MKPLIVELEPGARLNFEFVGWKNNLVAFYAHDADANPNIVELSPAYPYNHDDGQLFEFPKLEPSEIFPIRLAPPLCVASPDEINEIARRLFHKELLFPQPKHEAALLRTLKWCHANATKQEASEIAAVNKASPQELLPFEAMKAACGRSNQLTKPDAVEAQRQRQIAEIKEKYGPRMVLTLDALKSGEGDYAESLRDKVLIEAWAKETGTDLEKMKLEAQDYRNQWYRAWGSDIGPAAGAVTDDQAAVRYAIRFGSGATFYLRGVKTRNHLTPDEAADFEKLESLNFSASNHKQESAPIQAPRVSNKSSSAESEFEYVNEPGTEWRKAGPHMMRRGKFAEHQRTTKDDSTFRSLLELHRDRWYYPVKQIAKVRAGGKNRIAAMFDITDWDTNWRPRSAPQWVHPGKKSEPSSANQG